MDDAICCAACFEIFCCAKSEACIGPRRTNTYRYDVLAASTVFSPAVNVLFLSIGARMGIGRCWYVNVGRTTTATQVYHPSTINYPRKKTFVSTGAFFWEEQIITPWLRGVSWSFSIFLSLFGRREIRNSLLVPGRDDPLDRLIHGALDHWV